MANFNYMRKTVFAFTLVCLTLIVLIGGTLYVRGKAVNSMCTQIAQVPNYDAAIKKAWELGLRMPWSADFGAVETIASDKMSMDVHGCAIKKTDKGFTSQYVFFDYTFH